MFKDLKIDMPAIIALLIFGLFAAIIIAMLIRSGAIDADFKQTIVAIVMLAVGFYLGSSASSAKKDAPLIAAASKAAEPPAA